MDPRDCIIKSLVIFELRPYKFWGMTFAAAKLPQFCSKPHARPRNDVGDWRKPFNLWASARVEVCCRFSREEGEQPTKADGGTTSSFSFFPSAIAILRLHPISGQTMTNSNSFFSLVKSQFLVVKYCQPPSFGWLISI